MDAATPEAAPSPHPARRAALLLLGFLAIALLAGGLRWPRLVEARVFTDEGARIAAAQPMLDGAVLHRDVVHVGAPGSLLFNAAVLASSDSSLAAVRVSYFAISLLSLALVGWIAFRCFGALPGLAAALLFALSSFEVFYSGHATSESLMIVLSLASVAVVAGHFGRSAPTRFALAGLLAVAAGLAKQPGVLAGGAIAAVLAADILRGDAQAKRAGLQNGVGLALGAVLPLVAYLGWLTSEGALASGWVELTTYHGVSNAQLHQMLQQPDLGNPAKWRAFVDEYLLRRVFMAGGVLALLWPTALRAAPQPKLRNTLVLLALVSAAGVFALPQDYSVSFGHYWLMSEPWWIVLTASLVAAPVRERLRSAPRWALAVGGLALALVGVSEVEDFRKLYRVRLTSVDRSHQLEIGKELSNYDRILVLANPIHYFDTGKQPPVEPLNYFLLGKLVFASAQGTEAIARQVLPALEASDAVLMDARRTKLLEPVLEGHPLESRLEVIRAWGGTRLFRIAPAPVARDEAPGAL